MLFFSFSGLILAMDQPSKELHLFWATGCSNTLCNSEQNSIKIGSKKYDDNVLLKVEEFLQEIPSVTVVLTCDEPTRKSNKLLLENLTQRFSRRFIVQDVQVVKHNLLTRFPLHHFIIEKIMDNAVRGTPVVASDLYRLVGMVFSRSEPITIKKSGQLFLYSDIDAFYEFSSEAVKRYLEEALPLRQKNWYRRHSINNDLIFSYIVDLDSHAQWCEEVFLQARKTYEQDKKDDIYSVLDYFGKLHEVIGKYQNESDFNEYLELREHQPEHIIASVMSQTGPHFVEKLHFSRKNLLYKTGNCLDWLPQNEGREPWLHDIFPCPNALRTPCYSSVDDSIVRPFRINFFKTQKQFSAHFYDLWLAKQFGEEHTFTKRLKQHIVDSFIFTTDVFLSMSREIFLWDHFVNLSCGCERSTRKLEIERNPMEEWQIQVNKNLIQSFANQETNLFCYYLERMKSNNIDISNVLKKIPILRIPKPSCPAGQ